MNKFLMGVVLLGLAAGVQARPAEIDAYLAELRAVETARAPVSLQPLFQKMDAVQLAVMQIEGGQAWLESIDNDAYAALGRELRGFILSRGFDIYAQPDPLFLLALAERHGTPTDRAFFTLYLQYWSADYMPVFQRQTRVPTPCIRYDERVLPEVYEAWRGYVRQHPQTFMGFAEQALADVEEIMTLGTCACGPQETVERELRAFLKRFPDTPVAGPVRARLKQLREDPDKLPVRCR
jgi:hypothetical protein